MKAVPRGYWYTLKLAAVIGLLLGIAGPNLNPEAQHRFAEESRRSAWDSGIETVHASPNDEVSVGPLEAYQEALAVLRREYAGTVINDKQITKLTYAAIQGALSALNDPFTGFLDPDDWLSMQQTTQGSFEGIGAVLEPFGRDVRVVRPIPGSPAFKAGLKPGDIIFSVGTHDPDTGKLIKTTPTLGTDINTVVKLIKGPRGTKVTVTVLRNGVSNPIRFVIVRQNIEPPVVSYWMEDQDRKIGRIVLNEFNERADSQFERAWNDLKRQGLKALIFDLRFNPGGLFDVAVRIGSRFIEQGPLVIVQEKNGQRHTLYASSRVPKIGDIPLVVLINESSASASEIVAGAIKDHKRGILVGQHTFGKGLVQTIFPLADGSALRLTTSKYFTPSGHDINNKYDEEHRPLFGTGGIKPDIEVEQSPDWVDQQFEDKEHDTQLKKALEVLRTQMTARAR